MLASGALGLGALVLGSSCKGNDNPANDPSHVEIAAADLPELEIRGTGIDRFTTCPPPGDLGQHWIPNLPPWTAPPPAADAGAPPHVDQDFLARTADRTLTEIAVEATHRDFRSCYRQGLVRHPTQDGRVAIVLRIGADGRVAKVESYSACELATESIACMYDVAQRLKFPPTPSGETVIIPATFTSRDGVRRTVPTANDAYTAGAYMTMELARPALHKCEEQARKEGRVAQATGTFTMDVAADGRVTRAHVDPWTGDRALLTCAAHALETLRFQAPTSGKASSSSRATERAGEAEVPESSEPRARKATVIARLNFNPRQGTR